MATTTNQGQNVKDKVKDVASTAYDKAKDAASTTADKAKDVASNVADRAGDLASQAVNKASQMAHNVGDKASQMAHNVGDKANDATSSVGSGIKTMASSIREHAPSEGMMRSASESVADTLESSGRYLEEKGLSGVADDLTGLIRRNPIPAVLIGIGIGYLIASATRS